MKRIVILCDGTWNSPDMAHPTNVVRLGRTLLPSARVPRMRLVDDASVQATETVVGPEGPREVPVFDTVAQVPVYVEGVGTGRRGVTRLGRLSDRVLGGALGWGLMENVAEAYRHLVFLWEPGDEIHVFGFSRGAFTARSLVGLLRFGGLLSRAELHRLPELVARYTAPVYGGTTRRHERNLWWRAAHSRDVLVDPRDLDRLAAEHGDAEAAEALAVMTRAPRLTVAYLGVWDTVGAMGIPGHWAGAPALNRRHQFHDTDLSPMVSAARHALALDERRRDFPPTPWSNLSQLNGGRVGTPYRQAWFPGDHGSVGGGGEVTALSSAALDWVIDGAEAAGLQFHPVLRAELQAERDWTGPLRNEPDGIGLGARAAAKARDLMAGDRDGPDRIADVHDTARRRWAFETKGDRPSKGWPYRPRSLDRVARDMDAAPGDDDRGAVT